MFATIAAADPSNFDTADALVDVEQWISSLSHRHKVLVAGNHYWAFVQAPEEARALLGGEVVYLQDSAATIEGVRFWGSPWQPEYNDWAWNLPRGSALAARWALIPDGVDVLVTHSPPAGIGRCTTG